MSRAASGSRGLALLSLLALVAPLSGCNGCKGKAGPAATPSASGDGGPGAAGPGSAGRAFTVEATGQTDPFARITPEQTRRLQAGFKAVRAKDWKAARAEFEAVLAVSPDYLQARLPHLRAVALSGDFDEAVRLYGELLARDFVGGVGRLDKARDLAPLRASPAWARVPEIEAASRAAWARDVARGLFFVARMRDPGHLAKDGETPLRLNQEAWQYDPVTSRYRRLTDTDGHVYAIHVAPDRKALSFLLVDKIRSGAEGEGLLVDAKVGFVDLATLQMVGPFPLDNRVALVQLFFTRSGEPLWRTNAAQHLVDSTRTALVRSPRGPDEPTPPGGMTVADYDGVSHSDELTGVTLSADGREITVVGAAVPIRSARPIDAASLLFSPGRKRLAYAGVLEPCKLQAASKGDKSSWNELFVWQADKALASRVAQAASAFGSAWLDDDHLVYEGGLDREARLHVVDLTTRTDVVLKPRAGAGLHGVPTLSCDRGAAEDALPAGEILLDEPPAAE